MLKSIFSGKGDIPWSYLAVLLAAHLVLLLPPANPLRVAGALLLIGFWPGLSWANQFLTAGSRLLRWTIAAALSYSFTMGSMLLLHYLPGSIAAWQLLIALAGFALLPFLLTAPQTGKRFALFLPFRRDANVAPHQQRRPGAGAPGRLRNLVPLLFILLLAILLRTFNLSYSEFQGDEALALISAAEALEGHEDALFLRSKGPGEVAPPMAMWRLTGIINEPLARLPFTMATLGAIVTIYLIGQTVRGRRVGLIAALFFSLSGFTVAFGRIVQYQALVLWLSSLAFLLLLQWRHARQRRFAFLSGLCLGTGLLAHYDAILVLPALGWLFISPPHSDAVSSTPPSQPGPALLRPPRSPRRAALLAFCLFLGGLSLTALPFYLPYSLDPQANRTGAYVGERIGTELRNNLPNFFHFNTFYSSFYYLLLTGLLVGGFLIGRLWPARWSRRLSIPLSLAILAVVAAPDLLAGETIDLSFLPFALLLGGAFLAPPADKTSPAQQALIAWLAVPFLGYNFIVALGLTHIYTIIPAWSLLAALAWRQFQAALTNLQSPTSQSPTSQSPISQSPTSQPPISQPPNLQSPISQPPISQPPISQPHNLQSPISNLQSPNLQSPISNLQSPNLQSPISQFPNLQSPISNLLLLLFTLLSGLFLWNAFVRHDVEYWQDYPAGNLAVYWTPYDEPPPAGFFGFAHRSGWKAVGQKIVSGRLAGDYSSNEEPDVTTWYTRGAPRACDPLPEYYFLAGDLIDPVETPLDVIARRYEKVGQVALPNQKKMKIMQQKPAGSVLGDLEEANLARLFDQTAIPAAFARSARGAAPLTANFANLVQLVGYDLDARRAYPGGRAPVTLYWQALAPIPTGYHVFTHLENDTAGLIAQADGVPVCWTYPTDLWRPGQIIADQHAISIPLDAPPGDYPLRIGLYLADTFERLDILDEAGHPAGTSLTLEIVSIRNVD